MHISDGVLRARLDSELSGTELVAVERHLEGCARCRRRAEEIGERAVQVGNMLSALGTAPAVSAADARGAFARIELRSAPRRLLPVWRFAPAWGALAGVVVLLALLTSAPARAVAQKFLALLRVRSVVVVPMERDFIAEGKGKLISQLLSDSVTVTKEEKPQPVASKEEAGRLAGFSVRLPALRSDAPRLTVEGEHAFYFTAKAQRLETLLSVLGRPDLRLPDSLDGAKVVVDVPRGVSAAYGDCPKRGWGPNSQIDWSSCVAMMQVPAPTVVTVPELNLTEIAEAGLQLAGMSSEQARLFSRTVDWTSTLAIPLPRNAAGYETVAVDGVSGALITERAAAGRPPGWALIWIRNGVVYSLSGFGDPSVAALLVESLG